MIVLIVNNVKNLNSHLNPPPRVGRETIHVFSPLDGGRLEMGGTEK